MKKSIRKPVSLLLTLALLLSLAANLTLGASAATKSTIISSGSNHSTIATSRTIYTTRESGVSTASIYHEKGSEDYRSLAGSYTFYAEKSLTTSSYTAIFQKHTSSLGLSQSKKMYASSDVECRIGANKPTGTYKVYVIWSGVELTQKVVKSTARGNTTLFYRTVAYVPCPTSAVIDCTFR